VYCSIVALHRPRSVAKPHGAKSSPRVALHAAAEVYSLLTLVRKHPSNVRHFSSRELDLLIHAEVRVIKAVLRRDDYQARSFVEYCKRQKAHSDSESDRSPSPSLLSM
jgi:hypothetical protein